MRVLPAEDRDILLGRWLEAADVLRRLPPVKLPKEFGNAMPEVVRDYADAMGAESTRDKSEWAWTTRLEPASAAAITRMEEVTDWSITYLTDWPRHRPCSPRECLWAYSICFVARRSFAGLCKKRGWARVTAYRRIDQALITVYDGIAMDRLIIKPAPVDYVEQLEQISAQ